MKKIILVTFLVILSLGAFAITPDVKSKSDNLTVPDKKENKMSEKEINRLTKRVEETRGLSQQTVVTVQEGRRGRRYHDGNYRDNRRPSSIVFVGGGAAILLIILIILLV